MTYLLHPLPLPLALVPASVVDSDPMDEVDIPQVYTIEDTQDSELETGKQLACKVQRIDHQNG